MEFRWEVGKWRNQPLRRPQQFEDSTFLSHISRTWTLALPAFFGGAIGLFHSNRKSGRIETKTSTLSLWGHSKSLPVVTWDFIYDLKNPRKVLCYQKLETFSIWPGSSRLQSWPQLLTVDACHRTPCARRAPRALVNGANACPGGAMSQVWHPSNPLISYKS